MKAQTPKYCRNCGGRLAEKDRFCSRCGVSVDQDGDLPSDGQTGETSRTSVSKKLLKWGAIGFVGFIALLIVIGILVGEPKETGAPAAAPVKTPIPTRLLPAVGDTVVTANWEVGIPEAPHKVRHLSHSFYTANTAGFFVVVPLTIKNIGQETSTFSSWQLKLLDAQDRKYDPAEWGAQLAAGGESLFLKQINPGLSHTTVVVFEVPEDGSGFQLQIQGSLAAKSANIRIGEIP